VNTTRGAPVLSVTAPGGRDHHPLTGSGLTHQHRHPTPTGHHVEGPLLLSRQPCTHPTLGPGAGLLQGLPPHRRRGLGAPALGQLDGVLLELAQLPGGPGTIFQADQLTALHQTLHHTARLLGPAGAG